MAGKKNNKNAAKAKSKCETCRFATPLLCDWFADGIRDADMVVEEHYSKSCKMIITFVTGCRRYELGPLPALQRRGPHQVSVIRNITG